MCGDIIFDVSIKVPSDEYKFLGIIIKAYSVLALEAAADISLV